VVTYKTFSIIFGILISLVLVILIRRSRLQTVLLVWWIAIIVLMMIFAFFPSLVNLLGHYFGIAYPPIIISVVGLGLICIKVLSMDIYITKNEIRYKQLAQKMAILETLVKEEKKNSF
jgi:hypothetical protein